MDDTRVKLILDTPHVNDAAHSTQRTAHSTQHRAHSTQHTARKKPESAENTFLKPKFLH
jgi:hypothetical protein